MTDFIHEAAVKEAGEIVDHRNGNDEIFALRSIFIKRISEALERHLRRIETLEYLNAQLTVLKDACEKKNMALQSKLAGVRKL